MDIRGLIPWNFAELAEAVPIDCFNLIVFLVLFSCCCSALLPLAVPWVGLWYLIVTFPDHTYLPLVKGHNSVAVG